MCGYFTLRLLTADGKKLAGLSGSREDRLYYIFRLCHANLECVTFSQRLSSLTYGRGRCPRLNISNQVANAVEVAYLKAYQLTYAPDTAGL